MRRIGLCLVAAVMFCTLVLPVLASWNENGAWSSNGNAYAYVKGWWNIMDHYYRTYHKREVRNAGENAYTRFKGSYNSDTVYFKITFLDPYSGYYKYYFEDVDYIETRTDSDTGAGGYVIIWLVPGIEK